MELIKLENRNSLVCHTCHTTKSVKYSLNGMNFCNKCIVTAQMVVNAEPILTIRRVK